jgi:hypothetical protein
MSLTPEQVIELKSQLEEQIKDLPEDRKEEAQKQIDDLTPEALELMIKQQQSRSGKQSNKGIFRMIVDKEVPSRIIDENAFALAVLDIKPISKGHIIVISKKAILDSKFIPSQVFTLAKKMAKSLSIKLKAKSCEIQTESKFGEIILNVIPIYDKPLNLNSPRLDLSDKELDEIYQVLRIIKKPKVIRIKKPSNNQPLLQLKRRIP